MGRKEIEIDLDQVKDYASKGMTHEQISDSLGISYSTLYKRKREYKQFSRAIKEGQGEGIATITNALFQQSLSGNTSAAIFYLKNRAGWKDKSDDEIEAMKGKENLSDSISKLIDKLPS